MVISRALQSIPFVGGLLEAGCGPVRPSHIWPEPRRRADVIPHQPPDRRAIMLNDRYSIRLSYVFYKASVFLDATLVCLYWFLSQELVII